MKLKAKQIFYDTDVEKKLKQQALNKDMSLSEYITYLLTKQADKK